MSQDSYRRSHVAMVLFGPLAALVAASTFVAGRSYVLTGAQLALSDTGTGAGSTSAVVKVNGTAVTPALALAGAAAARAVYQKAARSTGPQPTPSGVPISSGDVITVDITAVPGTTAPKGGVVQLDMVEVDV